MDYTLVYIFSGLLLVTSIVIMTLKVLPKFTKQELSDEQKDVLKKAQSYANMFYLKLKEQYDFDDELLKEQVILRMKEKMPNVNKEILSLAYDIVVKLFNDNILHYQKTVKI